MKYIMSLGSDCSVATYLRDNGLREIAYPFDWCVTPMDSVINMLENNFEDFLKEDNLIFLEPAHRKAVNDENVEGELRNDIITPCYCKKYKMMLPHDFSINGKGDLTSVQEKYKKRIERLNEQLNDENSEFIFIANNAPTAPTSWRAKQFTIASGSTFINDFSNWKEKLANVLKEKYPLLKFKLYTLKDFKKI